MLYELLDVLLSKLANERECILAVRTYLVDLFLSSLTFRMQLAEKMSLVILFVMTKLREQHKSFTASVDGTLAPYLGGGRHGAIVIMET